MVAVRVVLSCDQPLVAESVCAALQARGHEVGEVGEVGLLLSELVGPQHRSHTARVVAAVPVPWVVLTTSSRGPDWGALYATGAEVVASTATGLDRLCVLVTDVGAGRIPVSARRRRALVAAWHEHDRAHRDLSARISSLTAREAEVLEHLSLGLGVRAIAESRDVAETTVRSQVKSVLRKLSVSSQLAAVAAYRQLQEA
jgi:DNA-binding NarL/FixJ family response regulator